MNKEDVLTALVASLETELEKSIDASKDAAAYATNEEARAESQWDTQGIEASYLAAGQATQARQWADAIESLRRNRELLLAPKSDVSLGALIGCRLGGASEHFFLVPVAGGHVVKVGETEVTVITPQSPIAGKITGKRAGEGFTLANGGSGEVVEIE